MKTFRVRISGKVQGVSYRANVQRNAIQLGITGWVKNNTDGSVEIEMTGEESKTEAMLRWCSKGPVLARVDKVEVEEILLKQFNTFEITQ